MKELRLSVSSIKTYCASKQKWAGKYILKIEDTDDFGDSLSIGKLFENWLMKGADEWELCTDVKNMEDITFKYDMLKTNYKGMEIPKGERQKKINGLLFNIPILGYIDIFTNDHIYDIKTVSKLTQKDSTNINNWSGMTYYQEYEFQLWVYHIITGIKNCSILEVSKEDCNITQNTRLKKDILISYCNNFEQGDEKLKMREIVNKYNPRKPGYQIIEFNFDEEYDKRMIEKYEPVVKEMKELWDRFNK